MRRLPLLVLIFFGCSRRDPAAEALRLDQIQMKGTHNSYHLASDVGLVKWAYTHAPLAEQLSKQDVRQFELDVYYDPPTRSFVVQHIPVFDSNTTCGDLRTCLDAITLWSREHSEHLPIIVMIELKDPWVPNIADELLAALDETVRSAFLTKELLAPAEVQGDAASVADALRIHGWPTIGELRGRTMLFLLAGDYYATYTANDTSLAGRAAFVAGNLDQACAGVLNVDDVRVEGASALIAAGHEQHRLVRTLADSDGDISDERSAAAIASGAQIIATDYPVAVTGMGYVLPWDDRPYHCNPVSAPAGCSAPRE